VDCLLWGNLEEQVRANQAHYLDSRLEAPDMDKAASSYQAILCSRKIEYRNRARLQLRADIHRQDSPCSRCQNRRLDFGDGSLDHLSERCCIETAEHSAADQPLGNDPEPTGSDQAPQPPSTGR